MANGFRIEIENLNEVVGLLEALGPKAKTALPEAVEQGAEVLKERMAARGPGDGIGVEMDGSTAYVGPLKEKFYYVFFELGTSAHGVKPRGARALNWGGDAFSAGHVVGGIAPEPFMRPAVDEGADAVGEKVGAVLREAVE